MKVNVETPNFVADVKLINFIEKNFPSWNSFTIVLSTPMYF